MINTQYLGATNIILGATNLNSVGIISIEEGYVSNGVTEFINISDFEVTNQQSVNPDQSLISLTGRNIASKIDRHNLINSIEYKAPFSWYDTFNNVDQFTSNYSFSDGVSINGGIVKYTFPVATTIRELILPTSTDIENVRIMARFAKNSNSLVTQLNTCFRYTDESNTMKIMYQNGRIYLQDRNSGYPGGGVTLVTVNGVSITPNADYYMVTNVFNNRVIHSGSTDGINYTRHIDYTGLYNWTLPYPNNKGLITMACTGNSGGIASLKEFMVSEIEDQPSFETAQRVLLGNGNIFQVNIQKELDGFDTLVASSGASWVSGISGSITRISATTGNSWATYLTSGSTFNDFVIECSVVGLSGSYPGLAFGTTASFYLFYLNLDGTATQTELYSNNRYIMQNIQTPFVPMANVVYDMKLVKKGLEASWYINGLRMSEVIGVSILGNVDATNIRTGLVTSRDGVSVTFSNLRISSLGKLSDSFKIENGDNLSYLSDRFLPDGFVRTSKQGIIDIYKKGASRSNFVLTDVFSSPNINNDVDNVPNLVEVRGNDLVAYVGNSNNMSNSYFNKTKSYITNDENITLSKDARQFGLDILKEENSKNESISVEIDSNPTIEKNDQVYVVDTTLGVSTLMLVDSFTKTYDAETGFRESITLTSV